MEPNVPNPDKTTIIDGALFSAIRKLYHTYLQTKQLYHLKHPMAIITLPSVICFYDRLTFTVRATSPLGFLLFAPSPIHLQLCHLIFP
jgi:hypothetical protein